MGHSLLNLFYISTPSLGRPVYQLCLICSRGPWKCKTAPPGRAVLAARCFVRRVNAVMSNTRMGETGKRAGWEKNAPPPSAPPPPCTPTPRCFICGSVDLEKRFYCILCRSAWSPPHTPKTDIRPPPHMHEPSKASRLLFSEATHEININLTFDHMP